MVKEVCKDIFNALRAGQLRDGEWLPSERELARQLGISRTVIREATKQLESEGFLEIIHGRGIRVVGDQDRVLARSVSRRVPQGRHLLGELVQVRLLIEPEIAAWAAENSTPAGVRKLRECQEKLKTAVDPQEAVVCDMDFHKILLSMAGNQVLEVMMGAVASLSRESREITLGEFGIEAAYAGHEKILSAVKAQNADAARLAMMEHLELTGQQLEKKTKKRS